jgi:cytochrome c oxidase accessory protein FixG
MSQQESTLPQELYAKRQKIYPRQVSGLFASLRIAAVLVLLGLYYGLPWISWDGRQAILFDLPARQFHLLGLTLWPQDFIYLAALLIVAALSLFFFTALAGRLWCGYACPQTVWTEVFLWIERMIEGERNKRIKLDKKGTMQKKLILKGFKHTVWILLSAWTGYTFVGYFTPIIELGEKLISFSTGPWETFWVVFYGFATYANAGWMREQVCIYMCPYARFQSAMFDSDTLIISYDPDRGEPRGARRRRDNPVDLGLGSCIDCQLCVQVCPTGIDIRNGLQYQCIGCAACIDICDDIMDKMSYPKGLIRYTTENQLESGKTHLLRPRVIIYGLILLGCFTALIYGLTTRTNIELDIGRDRNILYRELGNGDIENHFSLKILNKDRKDHRYQVSVEGLDAARLVFDDENLMVPTATTNSFNLRVIADPDSIPKSVTTIRFKVVAIDDSSIVVISDARFVGP